MAENITADQQDRFFADLIAASPQGFLAIDEQGTVVLCEGGTEQILGQPKSALTNQRAGKLPLIGPILEGLISRVLADKSSISYFDLELPGVAGTGLRTLDLDISYAPSYGGCLVVLHPRGQSSGGATPSRRRSLMMSHLSTALAHEIKNPLSGIRAAAQLAGKALPEGKAHLSDLIISETERLTTLIDQLQGLTDRDALCLVPVNLHETINHVCSLIDAEKHPATLLKRSFDPSLPAVLAHSGALIQILLNLVINAQEAAANQDLQITITTRYRQGFRLSVPDGDPRPLPIEIEITDTGPGVPKRLHDALFDPFVTTKEGGRGLGLAIVAQLIEDMGAHIRFEPRPGGGATFLINLVRAS